MSGERKSGIPAEVEMPAPTRRVMRVAWLVFMRLAIVSMVGKSDIVREMS